MFEKRLKMILEAEDDVQLPVDDLGTDDTSPDTDTIAAVDDVPTNPVVNYKKELTAEQIKGLEGWINEIDRFKTYLNGTDGGSVQSMINNAECDTLYKAISTSETKKISRIAQDLSALVESLRGYLLSHTDE